jgi:hypothetical protein
MARYAWLDMHLHELAVCAAQLGITLDHTHYTGSQHPWAGEHRLSTKDQSIAMLTPLPTVSISKVYRLVCCTALQQQQQQLSNNANVQPMQEELEPGLS